MVTTDFEALIDTLARLEAARAEQARLQRELTVSLAVCHHVTLAGRSKDEIAKTSYDPKADLRTKESNSLIQRYGPYGTDACFNVAILRDDTRLVIPPVYPNRPSVNGVFGRVSRECSDAARGWVRGWARRKLWRLYERHSQLRPYGSAMSEQFDAGLGCWTIVDEAGGPRWKAVDDVPAYRVVFEELPAALDRMPTLAG